MKNRYTKPVFVKGEVLSRVTAGPGPSFESQGIEPNGPNNV